MTFAHGFPAVGVRKAQKQLATPAIVARHELIGGIERVAVGGNRTGDCSNDGAGHQRRKDAFDHVSPPKYEAQAVGG